jgi:hypothetical protein
MDFFVMGIALVGLLIGSVLIGVFAALREANNWSASAMAQRTRRFVRREEFAPGKLR